MTDLNKIHGVFGILSSRGTATARTLTPNNTHLVDELMAAKHNSKPNISSTILINSTLAFLQKQKNESLTLHEIISDKRLDLCKHIGNLSFVIREPIDAFVSRIKPHYREQDKAVAIIAISNSLQQLDNYLSNMSNEEWTKVKHIVDATTVDENLFSGVEAIKCNNNIYYTPSEDSSEIGKINHTLYFINPNEKKFKIQITTPQKLQGDNLTAGEKYIKDVKINAMSMRGLKITNKNNNNLYKKMQRKINIFIQKNAHIHFATNELGSSEIKLYCLEEEVAKANTAFNHIKQTAQEHHVLRAALLE